MVAAGAQALAADMRAVWETERPPECPPPPGPQRRSRGRRRARQHQRRRSPEGVAELPQPETSARSVDGGAGEPTSAARPAAGVPVAAWEQLDAVDLQEELRHPVPTLQDVPPFMRSSVRGALVLALDHLRSAGDGDGASRKLFLLAPRMLLARPAIKRSPGGREELLSRAAAFQQGEWIRLLARLRNGRGLARQASPHSSSFGPGNRTNVCGPHGPSAQACRPTPAHPAGHPRTRASRARDPDAKSCGVRAARCAPRGRTRPVRHAG